MKIARVEALHCDGGWRPWTFVRIETDDGLVGWGECSDNRSPHGIAGSVRDVADLLIGQDPRPVERLYWDMLRRMRQNSGGVSHKAMAGIELALWDIKAKALGVPVYELFGGPMRDRMRLYWSHCGTTRARMGTFLGTPPLRTYDDIAALGREVVKRGFTALKTNMVIPGEPATVYFPGFASGINTTDGAPTVEILDAIDRLIGTFHQAVGPKVGLCLDLNYNFRTEGVLRIAKLLEKYDMQWLEYDNWDPDALLQIKQSTSTRLASCESLVTLRQYRPFLERHAVDVAIIDVPWNGFSQSVQIGRLAEALLRDGSGADGRAATIAARRPRDLSRAMGGLPTMLGRARGRVRDDEREVLSPSASSSNRRLASPLQRARACLERRAHRSVPSRVFRVLPGSWA